MWAIPGKIFTEAKHAGFEIEHVVIEKLSVPRIHSLQNDFQDGTKAGANPSFFKITFKIHINDEIGGKERRKHIFIPNMTRVGIFLHGLHVGCLLLIYKQS